MILSPCNVLTVTEISQFFAEITKAAGAKPEPTKCDLVLMSAGKQAEVSMAIALARVCTQRAEKRSMNGDETMEKKMKKLDREYADLCIQMRLRADRNNDSRSLVAIVAQFERDCERRRTAMNRYDLNRTCEINGKVDALNNGA